jgi:hypothetical protein
VPALALKMLGVPRRVRKPKSHELLAAALGEGRVAPERVAEVLGVRPTDVGPIAEGRVTLGGSTWTKLRRELGL